MTAWKVLSLLAFMAASSAGQNFKMESLDFTEAEEDPKTGTLFSAVVEFTLVT